MTRFWLCLLLSIWLTACGTCHQQVATARQGTETALTALEPYAPGVLGGEERAAQWLRATQALIEAAYGEWERHCPQADEPEVTD